MARLEFVGRLRRTGHLVAVGAYFALHGFAAAPPPTATGIEQVGTAAAKQIYRTAAIMGQYLVPTVLLLGAATSALGRAKRRRLLRDAAAATEPATEPNVAKGLSWHEFELLMGEAFRQQGYVVSETPEGADGGVDLELRRGGELHLVQCKHWRATKVGVAVVRELYGVMAARGAAGGFVVWEMQQTAGEALAAENL